MKICLVYPDIMKLPKEFDKVGTIANELVLYVPLGMLYIISNSNYDINFFDNCIKKLNNKELIEKLKNYIVIDFCSTVLEQK